MEQQKSELLADWLKRELGEELPCKETDGVWFEERDLSLLTGCWLRPTLHPDCLGGASIQNGTVRCTGLTDGICACGYNVLAGGFRRVNMRLRDEVSE